MRWFCNIYERNIELWEGQVLYQYSLFANLSCTNTVQVHLSRSRQRCPCLRQKGVSMNGGTFLRILNLGHILKYVVNFTLRSPLTRGKESKAITEWEAGWALLPIWMLEKLDQYFCPHETVRRISRSSNLHNRQRMYCEVYNTSQN
jgi:hypothetical protein